MARKDVAKETQKAIRAEIGASTIPEELKVLYLMANATELMSTQAFIRLKAVFRKHGYTINENELLTGITQYCRLIKMATYQFFERIEPQIMNATYSAGRYEDDPTGDAAAYDGFNQDTNEICRLVLPLALLCECTGEKKHLDMLERVTCDLESHIHPFGGVAEWDTGYKANCSRVSGGECSLLADNGDPVADLLYSSNWLPIGLAWAYRATGDERYRSLWRGIAEFMIKSQIHSDIKDIDGGWARAFDMDRREIFGLPHDAGWAACCIESGWTVAEIVTGLEIMKYIDK